jgi:TonB family protein
MMRHRILKVVVRVGLVALFVFLCGAGFPAALGAQEQKPAAPARTVPPADGMGDAAGLVANALAGIKAKQIAIFDFYRPDDPSWDALGRQLAADFRTRVDATPHKFKQRPYANIERSLQRDSFWQSDVSIADVAEYVVRGQNVDSFVTATITPAASDSAINIRLFVYSATKGGSPRMITTSIRFTPELKTLVEERSPELAIAADSQNSAKDAAGKSVAYTAPSCLYCPQAEYTKAAVDNKYQGMVTMITVIGVNGKAGPISIVKGLPYGLDAEAVSAVRKWRFKPALGPDGKPAPVRQTIEVQFHLY